MTGSDNRDAEPPVHFKRLLITGAEGFVGGHLMPALRRRLAPDAAVVTTRARLDAGGTPVLDLTDPESIRSAIAEVRPDLVVHLAGQASVQAGSKAAEDTWNLNVHGTEEMARAVARHCPDAVFFFASTVEVYGAAFLDGAVDEQSIPQPQSIYARSKLAAEQALAALLPATARLITVRPANHVGPGQDTRFVMPAFATQLAAIAKGLQPPVISVGNLDAERDFTDVRDVIDCYVRLLGAAPLLGARSTFNLASGHIRSIRSVLEDLIQRSGTRPEIVMDSARSRPSEIREARINAEAVRAAVGWEPHISWNQTVDDVYGAALMTLR